MDTFSKKMANIIAMNRLIRHSIGDYRNSEMPRDIEKLLEHLWYKTVGKFTE